MIRPPCIHLHPAPLSIRTAVAAIHTRPRHRQLASQVSRLACRQSCCPLPLQSVSVVDPSAVVLRSEPDDASLFSVRSDSTAMSTRQHELTLRRLAFAPVLQRENSQGWLGVQPCSPQARMSSSGSTRPTQPPSERHSREQERAPPQESRSSPFYQTSLPSMSLSASSAPRPDAYLAAGPPSYPSQQPLSRPMLPSFAELSKGLEPQSSHEYTPRPLTFQAPRPSSTDHLDHLTPLRSRPRASSSPHAPRGPPPTLNERRPGSSGLTSSWIPWDDPGKNNSPRSTLQPPTHLGKWHWNVVDAALP